MNFRNGRRAQSHYNKIVLKNKIRSRRRISTHKRITGHLDGQRASDNLTKKQFKI